MSEYVSFGAIFQTRIAAPAWSFIGGGLVWRFFRGYLAQHVRGQMACSIKAYAIGLKLILHRTENFSSHSGVIALTKMHLFKIL